MISPRPPLSFLPKAFRSLFVSALEGEAGGEKGRREALLRTLFPSSSASWDRPSLFSRLRQIFATRKRKGKRKKKKKERAAPNGCSFFSPILTASPERRGEREKDGTERPRTSSSSASEPPGVCRRKKRRRKKRKSRSAAGELVAMSSKKVWGEEGGEVRAARALLDCRFRFLQDESLLFDGGGGGGGEEEKKEARTLVT